MEGHSVDRNQAPLDSSVVTGLVVVPAYNEEVSLPGVIQELKPLLSGLFFEA